MRVCPYGVAFFLGYRRGLGRRRPRLPRLEQNGGDKGVLVSSVTRATWRRSSGGRGRADSPRESIDALKSGCDGCCDQHQSVLLC